MPESNKLLLCHHLLLLLAAAAAEPHHRISGYQFTCTGCVPEPAVTMNGQPLGTTVHDTQGGTVDVDAAVDSGLNANTYRARHSVARSAGHNGMIDVAAVTVGPEVQPRPYDWKQHTVVLARYGVARSAEPNGMIDALAVPGDLETESSAYDRPDHAILLTRYGVARSVGRSGMNVVSVLEAAEEEGPFAHGEHAFHLTRDGTQRSGGLAGAEAESFAYRRGHHVLHDHRLNRSTYERAATGLTSVPLVCFSQIPGSTIRAVQGPAADVILKNSPLTEHVAIHWHGIREISTPLADGTEGVMQCPPLPGDTFMVDRPGTYQAYNGVQRSVELNGTFAVSVPARDTAVPFAYVHLARYDRQRTAGLSNMQRTMVVVSLPERAEAEALVRDGEHAGLVDYWWHTQAAGAAASVPLLFVGEPGQHHSSSGRACLNYSRIYDATCPGCSPPPAFTVAAGGRDHIVTNLSDLNSGSLFDRTVQLGTGSLLFALIMVVQVDLDDQRKNVAMALLILLLVIPALPNAAMGQFHGGGHDQAAARPVDAAPALMPQDKAAADDHSACTYDPNTPDPHRCVHHINSTT